MKLNENKTQIIKFKNRDDNLDLNQTVSCKFLGIYLDYKLNFSVHTDELCKKLNSSCFALKILSNSVNTAILRMVYCATIQCRLTYGIVIWGSTSYENFNRLFRIQKRAIRIIHNAAIDEPCQQLFKSLNVMTLPCLYIYELCKYFIKYKNFFTNMSDVSHEYNTRHTFITYPAHSTAKFEKSTDYMARRVVNKFILLNREITLNKLFLKKVKIFLLNNTFYSLSEFLETNNIFTTV